MAQTKSQQKTQCNKQHKNILSIKGSRVHNLKNISLDIPKNSLVVITGLSGSGKSSLAFDTIYAEGQRRYAESLSSYARQFMDLQDKPDVDEIKGLSPTIAIDQKSTSRNPRSTVGTVTEIYDHLRLLFSRIGQQFCPDCEKPVIRYSTGSIVEEIRKLGRNGHEYLILAPIFTDQSVDKKTLLSQVERSGFEYVRFDGVLMKRDELELIDVMPKMAHSLDVVVGRITDVKKNNITSFVETGSELGNGRVIVYDMDEDEDKMFSEQYVCSSCGKEIAEIESRTFSFNSPHGACPRCTGLGRVLDVDKTLVIPNQKLTLAEGAIQPWTRITGNQAWYQKLLEAVAEENNFSVNKPVKDLSKRVMDVLYYGTDGKHYVIDDKSTVFEGIIPNLTQRHAETQSDYIRKEIEQYMRESVCPICEGKRLKKEALSVRIGDYSIADIIGMSLDESLLFFSGLEKDTSVSVKFTERDKKIAKPIIKEVLTRLQDLIKVGLDYLTLDRAMSTLSGGEAQRVRLSTQLSTGLTGVIYILDEPSIGLHPKDNEKLIGTLKELRDLGNSVIVVEHDEAMMLAADYLIDIGPGAGVYGGEIVAAGTVDQVKKTTKSPTAKYLNGKVQIPIPKKIHKGNGKKLTIVGAKAFNLKNIDVDVPLGKFVCVTGVSGSGKSSLIIDILSKALASELHRAKAAPSEHKTIKGLRNVDKVIAIDQTAIGRTPRSNPATYTGLFTLIRDLFTQVPEAELRGYGAGKFSFNVKGGGRCEACAGEGYVRIPMQFLTDVFVECQECEGRRYNKEALEIHYKGKNISDVLDMTVEEAYRFFSDISSIADKLQILRNVGLGYVALGQPATTLSGGEAQRVKLATELSRRATGKTLYILDEPTTGLHFEDIKQLLNVLSQLVDKGNTVLVIEHNLDVIKSADWVIDMGPEGGKRGGEVVAEGEPKQVAKTKQSFTGQYLKDVLKK